MSAKTHLTNKTLHLLVAVLILLTSVPMSTSVAAASAAASDDGGDVVQAEPPVQEQERRLEPGVRLYAVCDPAVARPGEQATCSVTALNEEDEDATDLKLSARLPKGLSLAEGGRRWNATVEKLAMGESVALELALDVGDDATGPLSFEVEARDRGGVRGTTTAIVGVGPTDEATDKRMDGLGGRFAGQDGRIRVHFPPGALKKEAQVEARVHKQGIDPRGRARGKEAETDGRTGKLLRFSLEAEDAATGAAIHHFDVPVTLEVDLRGLVPPEGLLPGQHLYLIHVVDPEAGETEDVPFEYDPETGVMTAELEHFSDYDAGTVGEGWQPMLTLPVADKFSGSASYSYPIAAPAGRNGLQPNLTISYNSRRLDGLLGGQGKLDSSPLPLGWSVGGVPEIVRATERESVAFTLKDHYTLSLNGASHELKPVSVNQTCGRYYVENAPGIYVERFNDSSGCGNGSANDTSDYWIVRTPDGTEYRMGYTINSEVSVYDSQKRTICWGYCSGTGGYKTGGLTKLGAYRWRVDQVIGPLSASDNDRMTFTYREKTIYPDTYIHTSRSAPASVQYNYNSTVYLSKVQSVFKSDDPDRGDFMRVLRFDVIDGGQTIRKYAIDAGKKTWSVCNETYEVWQMASIQEIGRGGTAMPAETFEHVTLYNKPGECYPYRRVSAVNTRYGGRVEIDYVGDGRYVDDYPLHGYSYRVSQMRTYDGVHDPQYGKVAYQYGTACYDQTGTNGRPCQQSPDAEASGGLVGHDWVKETVWDYDSTVLGHNVHDYYVCPDDNPANCTAWKVGRELQGQTYTAPNQATLLKQVDTNWVNAPFGRNIEFVYQQQVVSTDHAGGSSVSAKVTYNYAVAQQGGAQYGNLTHVREYDDAGALYRTRVTAYNPNANASVWIVGTPKREELREGDTGGQLLSRTDYYYDGHNTDLEADPSQGKLTLTKVYDANNLSEFLETEYTYDSQWGHLIDARDALNNHSTVDYDDTYHMYPVESCSPAVAGAGQLCTTTRYYGVDGVAADDGLPGQVKQVWDANGPATKTEYRYDPFGRPAKVIRPLDGATQPTVEYVYHDAPGAGQPAGLWVEMRQREVSGQASTLDSVVYYDGLGRQIQASSEAEDGKWTVASTEYDALGRVVKGYLPRVENSSAYTAPAGSYTLTSYDALGRVGIVTAPDGTQTRHYYGIDDNCSVIPQPTGLWLHSVVDGNGHAKSYVQDAFGRLVVAREFEGTTAPYALYAETTYEYDALDHLTQVTDDANNVTTMHYDGLGRKDWMDDPDMGRWDYDYDLLGNLAWQKDAKGCVIDFEYDELSRLTEKSYGGTCSGATVNYTYDAYDGATQFGKGRRTGMSDGSGWTAWTYDKRGRVSEEDKHVDGTTYTTEYLEYDALDRVVQMEYPDGEVVHHAYNDGGALEGLSGYDPYVQDIDYNPMGQITDLALGNGLKTNYTYDPLNSRLNYINVSGLLRRWYEYDPVGNVTQIVETPRQAENWPDPGFVFRDTFDAKDTTKWTWSGHQVVPFNYGGNNVVKVTGTGSSWDANFHGSVADVVSGEGIQIEFRVSATTDKTVLALNQGNRRWGLWIGEGEIRAQWRDMDSVFHFASLTAIKANVWYVMRLKLNDGDDFEMKVWERDNPSASASFSQPMPNSAGQTWWFSHWVWQGTTYLDNYTEFTHDTFGSKNAYNWTWNGYQTVPFDDGGNNVVKNTGTNADWNGHFYRSGYHLNDGMGLQLRFKVDRTDTRAHFSIEADDSVYRRFGVRADDGKLYVQCIDYGSSPTSWYPADLITDLQVNTWYVVRIVIDDAGGFYVEAYQEDAPEVRGSHEDVMPAGKQWRFHHWMWRGNTFIDDYREFDTTQLAWVEEGVQTFTYDHLDRLTHAQATGGPASYDRTYAYDEIGNMTYKSNVGSYTYPTSGPSSVRPHAVTSTSNGWSFQYDPNGNMTQRIENSKTYVQSFNAENKLQSVTEGGTQTTFTYDGDGNRVKKVENGVTTTYVGGYYEKKGSTVTKYYYAGSQRVAMRRNGVLIYLHGDHLGSTSLTTDAGGGFKARVLYYPYGEERYTEGTLTTDYGFTGQRKIETYLFSVR